MLSEETYRLTLEATTDELWDWDVSSGTAYFSPGFYTMLGYDSGDFPTTYEAWKDLIHPDDQTLVVTDLIRQEPIFFMEHSSELNLCVKNV